MLNVIGNKYIFLGLSSILVIAAVFSIFNFGFKQGIDFVGGTLWEVKSDVKIVQSVLPKEAMVTPGSNNSLLVRLPELSETDHQKYVEEIKKQDSQFEELSFESIGPAVGQELRKKAVYAFIAVLLIISLYIAFAFRKVSFPVKSWKYGVVTLVTLFHDALVPAGLMAFLGSLNNIEVGTNFIVALLVVMGFSVHDTIVVFDRIRENIKLEKSRNFHFANLVNRSVNETMARSINTSLTLVLVLVALLFLGSANLYYFVLVILVGTVMGTYSSIFVASPLLTLLTKN